MAHRDPVAHAWAQRVVAWHNQHPLARRIVAAELSAPGHVELPFSADRKRRLFSERFLPRLRTGRIAALARRDGSAVAPEDALPRRLVAVDPKRVRGQEAIQPLWLATVSIGSERGATRVLLGSRAVLGRRLWSRPRMAFVSIALLLAAWLPRLPELADVLPATATSRVLPDETRGLETAGADAPVAGADAGSALAADAHDAPATSGAAAASGAEHGQGHAGPAPGIEGDGSAAGHAGPALGVAGDGSAAGHAGHDAPAHAAGSAGANADVAADASQASRGAHAAHAAAHAGSASHVGPADAHTAAPNTAATVALPSPPRLRQPFPPQRPQFDPATKAAAREAVARARAARAVATGGNVFALAMPRMRTQAESELLADALRSAAAAADAPPGWHVEVLPAGDDWRAVGWPFTRVEDAERLRDRIAARGLRIELIAF